MERSIVLKGKTYLMKPFTVEAFINQMKEVEEIGNKPASGVEMYETTLRMILRAFPDLPEEVLRQCTTQQVDAIYSFLRDRSDEEIEHAEAAGN